MTLARIITAIEFVFMLYFIGLNAVYLGLNVISLFTVPRYMELRVLRDLPQVYSGLEPPISLIAPAYNEAAVIVTSIRSLLQLNYPEFELVIVNDGSTDETLEVLKRSLSWLFFPKRIAIVCRQNLYAIYRSKIYPNLRVIDKENGGKADSTNTESTRRGTRFSV
jgi:cellulose synthase/poly-beta-1,6-N-acetylglucosamine synthase-like glycosyltransferase